MTAIRLPVALVRQVVDFIPADVTPACREDGVDPDLFFPIGDRYSDEGRQICWRCPVEEACAAWAIETDQQFGIWGGLTPDQLRARRRLGVVAS